MAFDPGWYPDPQQGGRVRWWDGSQWAPDSASRRPRRRWLLPLLVAVVLVVAAAIAVPLALSGDDDNSSFKTGYGQDAVNLAHALGKCTSVKRFGSTARCETSVGANVTVTTVSSETEESYTVTMIEDRNSGQCLVVFPGVIVGSLDKDALVSIVGPLDEFAQQYGGEVKCPSP